MRNFKLPSKKEINFIFASFSRKEKIVFTSLFLVLILSTILLLNSVNQSFMVEVPQKGGSQREGIIGVRRFVNPILAFSDVDRDLVSLIYSGLMRKTTDGSLIPDLAEKYENSENGLEYTFTLKKNAYFHDGKPVTADDVLFTINKTKDAVIKSPHKVDWEGITAQKIDERTIKFTLKYPYALFLESTTLGIMPAHIWGDSPLELNSANTDPIGSGPFMVKSANKLSSGIIDRYELKLFKKFTLGEPFIENITLRFYQNEDDLLKGLGSGEVEGISSVTPVNAEKLAKKNYQVESSVLPRVFGLFFNQNQNQLFTDKAVIKAINEAIDKNKIVREVLLGYGEVIDGPIPPNMTKYEQLEKATAPLLLSKVEEDLAKAGWVKGSDGFLEKVTTENKKKEVKKLEFSISTGNVTELVKAAELIKEDLAAIGIKAEVKTFETGNLNQDVIRPRKYEALLFGEIVNNESDLYAFWHSSQRKDPGLNVAMYTNAKVDKILGEAFVSLDENARVNKYIQFSEEIKKDMPAVFLFSPDFIYIVPKDLKNFKMDHTISPSNRYLNSYLWYTQTEKVWKIFAR